MAGISSGLEGIRAIAWNTVPILKVSLGNDQVWPAFDPVLTPITAVGAYTYNIPAQAEFIDVILLGAGGGGQGMGSATAWGQGGFGGSWVTATLRRGVDIPWAVTQITGVIGAGGTAGPGYIFGQTGAGGKGGDTTATFSGGGTLIAAGGAGGNSRNLDFGGKSPNPADMVYRDRTYEGGAEQITPSGIGYAPGGGGAAATVSVGITGLAGGPGARGQAWFLAY
ncbi:hypothetical protein Chy4_0029 [Mycobacterium phage Chy4]|uniref:minor tail protein n=1 Tax=Mycobacterium phage Chy5 TaxID=1327948 RepID=UPI00032B7C80|nr:minor tail protein [Mycobacterium phage Chy5]YP_008060189.1 minor tail protein [Mycobacterium phage Chy4]AGK85991.1 hypothetical protein Chy4_0029 [Mycobacterium phage Chy4]AGK86064.1 hypothetical protein Chy5_0029 [Mycobacterium phage Chy5]